MMSTHTDTPPIMRSGRAPFALVYGVLCYLIFLGTFLYSLGFVGDLVVPKSLDIGPVAAPFLAIVVDVALLGLFAAQHSIMARPTFKQWWTSLIPPQVERSTYVLFASLALLLLYWQWLPVRGTIWDIQNPIGQSLLLALYGMGWLIVLLSTFLISHVDLFGLRQVYLNWRTYAYTCPGFQTPALYQFVRHPLMVGFLIAFWATPRMTIGHLIFSLATTGYIVVGIYLEERDLVAFYGETYRRYQQRVRMLLPLPKQHLVTPKQDISRD